MKDVRAYLLHIWECIQHVREFTAGGRDAFDGSEMVRAAVVYKLQTMAESTLMLPDTLKDAHPEVDWAAIRGFRNRLVHAYLSLNMNIVWDVVVKHLSPLDAAAAAMLDDMEA